jgi:Tol biopolymer transport system component
MLRPVVFLLLFLPFLALAQSPQTEYGKNRVQYKRFNWRYYSTENFDIYYYDGGENNAKLALEFLEEEFEEITETIGYPPFNKTKIFLYNSIAELQQSNINLDGGSTNESGQTDFIKSQIEIAFPGSFTAFREELVLKVSEMLINEMMFGGSLAELLQSTYLFNLPEWFTAGVSEYLAKGWSVELDDYMRDLFSQTRVKKLTRFEGKDAKLIGHSIWNYLAERYGRTYIANILNLTRITRNEEGGIANSIGVPFRQFLLDWQEYYANMQEPIAAEYFPHDEDNRFRNVNRRNWLYNHVRVSPNGDLVAYSENYKGRYRVVIREVATGKEDVVFRGGYKVINQEIDVDIPLISWRDNGTLGIISNKHGKNFLWLYEISTKSKLKKDLSRFNHIKDFDFSETGNLVVFSGDIYGQNDIFVMSMRRNAIKRITDDPYDELSPRFVPNTTAIVFSSNRETDSLKYTKLKIGDISPHFNLFMLDLDTTKTLLKRLTNNFGKNINPVPISEDRIYYLSDQKGILNLYVFNVSEGIYNQVTSLTTSIYDYDINYNSGLFAYTATTAGKDYVYFKNGFNLDQTVFSSPTVRQQILQARFVNQRAGKIVRKKPSADEQRLDLPTPSNRNVIGAIPVAPLDSVPEVNPDTTAVDSPSDDEIIDTDNYVFDTEIFKEEPSASIIENYRRNIREKEVIGPIPYKPKFSADNIVASWGINQLYGIGDTDFTIVVNTEMGDIFEDHKIRGGFETTPRLKSGRIFGEYEYLKFQIDYKARFEREVIIVNGSNELGPFTQKYARNDFSVQASLPFNVTSRVSVQPFYSLTNYYDLDPNGLNNAVNTGSDTLSSRRHYIGGTVSYTYDNTISYGLNLKEGLQAKVSFSNALALNSNSFNFSNINFDIRNFQKVHREIIFATRLFYGRFLGNRSPSYFLGGVDNWIANDINVSDNNDPLFFRTGFDNTNVMFSEFVTGLRGFDFNEFNGSNSILFSAELRVPVIRYLSRGPISSNFFRNFQIVGFFDAGTAWDSDRLIPSSSDVNERTVPDSFNPSEPPPFVVNVKELTNPWLYSSGFGIRSVLLGFFMKMDVAWAVDNYEVQPARIQVSLGYDF